MQVVSDDLQQDLVTALGVNVSVNFFLTVSNDTVLLFSIHLPVGFAKEQALVLASNAQYNKLLQFLLLHDTNSSFTHFCLLCVGDCISPSVAACETSPPPPPSSCDEYCRGGIAFSIVVGAAAIVLVGMIALDPSHLFNAAFLFPWL